MTTHDREHTDDAGGDAIGQLLKLAGARQMPDAAQMDRARAVAHAEWTRLVQHRARRRSVWVLAGAALAASVVGALAWPWLARHREPPPLRVRSGIATIRTVAGPVFLTTTDRQRRGPTAAGARIGPGERVETSKDSRAAFVLTGGVSVRLDRGTAIVLDSDSQVTLERGAAYVDSGGEPNAAALEIRPPALEIKTPLGSVRHVGTQFEVRLQESSLRVRVREGAIAVERAGMRWMSQTGEALMLARSGPPVREMIPTFGSDWKWVTELAEPFHLEGARVPALLDWVSREQGWRWQLEDPRMRDHIEQIVLHGSIDGLTPEEALAAVLPTCGLTFRREGERLIVGVDRKHGP